MERRQKASTVTSLDGGDCSNAKANDVHLSINDLRLIVSEAMLVRKMSLESQRLVPRFWWVGIWLNKVWTIQDTRQCHQFAYFSPALIICHIQGLLHG